MNSMSVAVSCGQPTANATPELKRIQHERACLGGDVLNSYKRPTLPSGLEHRQPVIVMSTGTHELPSRK